MSKSSISAAVLKMLLGGDGPGLMLYPQNHAKTMPQRIIVTISD